MAGSAKVFRAASKLHDGDRFGDELRGGVLQNVRTQDSIGSRIGHELDQALNIFIGQSASIGPERKLADADIDPLSFA